MCDNTLVISITEDFDMTGIWKDSAGETIDITNMDIYMTVRQYNENGSIVFELSSKTGGITKNVDNSFRVFKAVSELENIVITPAVYGIRAVDTSVTPNRYYDIETCSPVKWLENVSKVS